jgi:hypothetical protein
MRTKRIRRRDPAAAAAAGAHVRWLDELGMGDVSRVGGKNASLGELTGR